MLIKGEAEEQTKPLTIILTHKIKVPNETMAGKMIIIEEVVNQAILWTSHKMEATALGFILIHKAQMQFHNQEVVNNSSNNSHMIC
jgi:hypothetical protein